MEKLELADFLKIKDKETYIKGLINNNSIGITFSYLSDFSNAKKLRDIVFMICEAIKLDGKTRNRIIIVTDELNNNAIEYGSKFGDINTFKIIIKREGKEVYINIEVTDSGKGNETKSALDMEYIRKERIQNGFKAYRSIRGRGLFMIIVNLVDRLYFKDSKDRGLIVGIEKVIK